MLSTLSGAKSSIRRALIATLAFVLLAGLALSLTPGMGISSAYPDAAMGDEPYVDLFTEVGDCGQIRGDE